MFVYSLNLNRLSFVPSSVQVEVELISEKIAPPIAHCHWALLLSLGLLLGSSDLLFFDLRSLSTANKSDFDPADWGAAASAGCARPTSWAPSGGCSEISRVWNSSEIITTTEPSFEMKRITEWYTNISTRKHLQRFRFFDTRKERKLLKGMCILHRLIKLRLQSSILTCMCFNLKQLHLH